MVLNGYYTYHLVDIMPFVLYLIVFNYCKLCTNSMSVIYVLDCFSSAVSCIIYLPSCTEYWYIR